MWVFTCSLEAAGEEGGWVLKNIGSRLVLYFFTWFFYFFTTFPNTSRRFGFLLHMLRLLELSRGASRHHNQSINMFSVHGHEHESKGVTLVTTLTAATGAHQHRSRVAGHPARCSVERATSGNASYNTSDLNGHGGEKAFGVEAHEFPLAFGIALIDRVAEGYQVRLHKSM